MIYLTGDTHAEFHRLGNKHFSSNDGDYLMICGDFGGVWDGTSSEQYWLKWLSKRTFTTLFVSGNHENFDLLSQYPVSEWHHGKVQFINNKVIHLLRGQVYDIDGHTFFTMGGASSHDVSSGILEKDDPNFAKMRKKLNKEFSSYRINHITWWKEELPKQSELDEGIKNLENSNWTVDYIISHCAPSSIQDSICPDYMHDLLTDYFDEVMRKCTFKQWFFGHYHKDQTIGHKFTSLYNQIIKI